MPHRNRNWQLRWTVDRDAREAVHESGLVARFSVAPSGEARADVEKKAETLAALKAANIPRAEETLVRLEFEAAELAKKLFRVHRPRPA